MEAAEAVDDALRRVRAHSNRSAVRADGEYVRGPSQCCDGHPARVGREGNVLHFARRVAAVQCVQVMDGALFGAARRRVQPEYVEVVPLPVGRQQ